MKKPPIRSKRFGVGKEIGGAIYVHRRYESVLPEEANSARVSLPDGFEYTVVKFDLRVKSTSFISSPDFDLASEPYVGDIVVVTADNDVRRIKQAKDPFIYHHKWLFVRDDYEGFDVQESRERSLQWLQLANVDSTKIGRKSYWESRVIPQLCSEHDVWIPSKEMALKLNVSSCELSHLRKSGELDFRKRGNAYFYKLPS